MQHVLISPSTEQLYTSLSYLKDTLGCKLTSTYVCTSDTEVKTVLKQLNNTRVFITHCYLLPWTIINLNFIISLHKQYKVSIYLLDLQLDLTVDINGYPAINILTYLTSMKQYNQKYEL